MTDFIPYSVPDIGEDEISAVVETLRSGWVTSGPSAKNFESEFATAVGGDVECVAVNSATAGLHLALEACGIGPGDEVIVPTWTFTASAEVVRYLGATPVIVDVEQDSLNISVPEMVAAVTPNTKAVIVVHFGGLSIDMPHLQRALSGFPQVQIIEDAAHAFPASENGVTVGSARHSDVAVFSFYANKTMTTGEGGMLTTRNPDIAKRARIMRLHGIDRDVFDRYRSTKPAWAYDIVAPGFKYNLPDTAAALGRVQLRRAPDMRNRRAQIAARYTAAFSHLPVALPKSSLDNHGHAWHLYVVRLDDTAPVDRDGFISALSEAGIGSSVHFIPLHMLSYWRSSLELKEKDFPIASAEFPKAVSLPLFSKMTDTDVDRVIANVQRILTR